MNNEIKEILDYLKPKYDIVDEFGYGYKKVKFKDCKILLDYITNLQEENERLKEIEKEHKNCTRKYWQQKAGENCLKYQLYKSRNEKAKSLTNRTIEIIKQQPSGNDEWILERLNGINYCLDGDEE